MAMKGGVAMAMAVLVLLSFGVTVAMADGECSSASPCPDTSNCCSQYNYCGKGELYCGHGCRNGPCTGGTPPTPPSPPSGAGLGAILTRSLYEEFFPGHLAFYSYDNLIEAAKLFPQFGTTGDIDTRKREIAAFVAHATHETSGLTKIVEQTNDPYCDPNQEVNFPCKENHFNGRGALQLSWNYNYGRAGDYLNYGLLGNPDLVATDSLISFKASLWFWNKYGDNVIPHIHDVITGNWQPNSGDIAANRVPGFGVTIVIINGGLECNKENPQANARVEYFKKFCNLLGVAPGANLDCKNMIPFYSVNRAAAF